MPSTPRRRTVRGPETIGFHESRERMRGNEPSSVGGRMAVRLMLPLVLLLSGCALSTPCRCRARRSDDPAPRSEIRRAFEEVDQTPDADPFGAAR